MDVSKTSFQVLAIYITDDVNASLVDVVKNIRTKTSGLDHNLIAHQVEKKGTFKYTFKLQFKTVPKETENQPLHQTL